MSDSGARRTPHLALLPSAGMGHLTPFLRLALVLVAQGCEVTLVIFRPTVSSAESDHISSLLSMLPQIHPLEFHLPNFDSNDADPFYLHCEAIRSSATLLSPLLSTRSLSSLIIDISLASSFIPIAVDLRLPSYILFTSSAAMLSLFAYLPGLVSNNGISDVRIPGMPPLPKSSIPPALHDPANLFTTQFVKNGRALVQANGILVNTFEWLEREALAALNSGMVVDGIPPVTALGPLPPTPNSKRGMYPAWLDAQPPRSVVYVSFGSRTALSRNQTKELGIGLENSGCRFLWVIKSKIVDREEEEGDLEELLGDGFMGRVMDRGMVVRDWVDQEEVLAHPAIGGFMSHCGWNSAMEAAAHGVPMLAWPRGADQRVNGGIVERSGLGIWMRGWSWEAEEKEEVVKKGEEIGERVRELMGDARVAESCVRVREEAVMAVGVGGSSQKGLVGLIQKWGDGEIFGEPL